MNEELQATREKNKNSMESEIDNWKYQRKSCVNCEYKIICAGECSETLGECSETLEERVD